MTLDEKNQVAIKDTMMSERDYDESITQLLAEVERMKLRKQQVIDHKEAVREEKRKKRVILDKTVTTCFPLWVFERLRDDFMPLFKEKVHYRRTEFDPSTALRYLVYYAVRFPQEVKGVELEDLRKFFNHE